MAPGFSRSVSQLHGHEAPSPPLPPYHPPSTPLVHFRTTHALEHVSHTCTHACKGESVLNVVMGVNDDKYKPKTHHLLSAASCTTNCIAPPIQVGSFIFVCVTCFVCE